MEYISLNNGVKMPILGYGVYQVTKEECERCVLDALKVGYRAIDTAQSYFNEEEVGNAIQKFYKAGYDIITDLCSITDNLIIFCIQIIQTGINNILEMFFQKFQKLFITTTQNGNAVNIIAGN